MQVTRDELKNQLSLVPRHGSECDTAPAAFTRGIIEAIVARQRASVDMVTRPKRGCP